jgi:hypothetical protein
MTYPPQVNENIALLKETAEKKQIRIVYEMRDAHYFFADYNMINTVITEYSYQRH